MAGSCINELEQAHLKVLTGIAAELDIFETVHGVVEEASETTLPTTPATSMAWLMPFPVLC